MTDTEHSFSGPPEILDHDLNQYFAELIKFESTAEMERSELFRKIRVDVERILNAVGVENVTSRVSRSQPDHSIPIRALAWNLERGIRFDGILDTLTNNPRLKG